MLVELEADVERFALDDQRRVLLPPEGVQLLVRLRPRRHRPEGIVMSISQFSLGLIMNE